MKYFKIFSAFENDEYSHHLYSCPRKDFCWYDDDAVCEAGYTVNWKTEDGTCYTEDDDEEPECNYYFWIAGWEDDLDLEWFDTKDEAYDRLVSYKEELESKEYELQELLDKSVMESRKLFINQEIKKVKRIPTEDLRALRDSCDFYSIAQVRECLADAIRTNNVSLERVRNEEMFLWPY